MTLHDLLHRSEQPEEPRATVKRTSGDVPAADLQAQVLDQQRQIEELTAVKKDLNQRLEQSREIAKKRSDECHELKAELKKTTQDLYAAVDGELLEKLELYEKDYEDLSRKLEFANEEVEKFREALENAVKVASDRAAEKRPVKYRVDCGDYVDTIEAIDVAQNEGSLLFFAQGGGLCAAYAEHEWDNVRRLDDDLVDLSGPEGREPAGRGRYAAQTAAQPNAGDEPAEAGPAEGTRGASEKGPRTA